METTVHKTESIVDLRGACLGSTIAGADHGPAVRPETTLALPGEPGCELPCIHVFLRLYTGNAPHTRAASLAGNLILCMLLHSVGRTSYRAAARRLRFQTSRSHTSRIRRPYSVSYIACVPIQRRSVPPACVMPTRLLPSIGRRSLAPLATPNHVPIAEKHSSLGSWAAKTPICSLPEPSRSFRSLVDRFWQA